MKNLFDMNKPVAATWGDWKKWHNQAKKTWPVRYFLSETLPSTFRRVYHKVTYPFTEKFYALRILMTDPKHVLRSPELKKGEWYDLDHRLLYCMMGSFVDFVEIECAKMWCNNKEFDRNYGRPRFHRTFPFSLIAWRSREAGLEYLNWASKITYPDEENGGEEKLSDQAKAAIIMLDIFKWWTERRPNRPDPDVVSGYADHLKEKKEKHGDDMDWVFAVESKEEAREKVIKMVTEVERIEQLYYDEDSAYMTALINVRRHLWT